MFFLLLYLHVFTRQFGPNCVRVFDYAFRYTWNARRKVCLPWPFVHFVSFRNAGNASTINVCIALPRICTHGPKFRRCGRWRAWGPKLLLVRNSRFSRPGKARLRDPHRRHLRLIPLLFFSVLDSPIPDVRWNFTFATALFLKLP